MEPMPERDRPDMPDGYGIPSTDGGLLEWPTVEEHLKNAVVYWMSTTRPDGRPHVVPRWGVWVGGHFYYDGSPTTRHARNLASNGACSLHVGDGTNDVIILEGSSQATTPPGLDLGGVISREFVRKYGESGYSPTPDAWEGEMAGGLCLFTPAKGISWFSFPTDVTRFTFA